MPERSYFKGKAWNWISSLFAGLVLAAISNIAGAEIGNLGSTLKQLGYEQIELRRTDENHLFLFGQVDGRRRSCLVDTGWSLTAVRTNTAQRSAPPGMVRELKLGRVTLTNEPVVVHDLRVNGQPAAFEMVLGCDFMIRHHAVIDCAGRRLYLRREALANELTEYLAKVLQQRGGIIVEMTRREPLALTCATKLNGCDVELIVDTGAVWSCLDTEIARALGLRAAPSANQITGAGTTGKREFGVTRVKDFKIEGREMKDMNFAVLDLADWELGPNGKTLRSVGGILGGDKLAANAVIIDCGQLKLWLRSQ